MPFAVFADGSANLPQSMLEGIRLLPDEYTLDGVPQVYNGDVDHFDGHAFYEKLRHGSVARTSLLNTQLFLTHFAPLLAEGIDVIYVAMSSGISGTYHAARIAAGADGAIQGPLCAHRRLTRLRLRQWAAGRARGEAQP
jgi:fatty acid-binding protein DegV